LCDILCTLKDIATISFIAITVADITYTKYNRNNWS